MYEWLPPDVELMTETSAADWVVERLRPWDRGHVRIHSFMPDVFESYAHVSHPKSRIDGRPRRSDLVSLTTFLGEWTDPGEPCWFCLWEGWGSWWAGAHSVLASGTPTQRRAAQDPLDDERDRVLRATPRVRGQHREYFLFRGSLASADGLAEVVDGEWPNLCWPDSRAWFVSTEIYALSTYVGGSAALISGLVASPGLNAARTRVDAGLDPKRMGL